MSNIISIKEINFKYNDKQIFSNFSLEIKQGEFVSLIGLNGSGKSTLVKILAGLLNFDGEILIDGILLNSNNIKKVRKKIGVMFNNIDSQIISDKVFDNIAFVLTNLGISKNQIIEKVNEVARKLGIFYLLEKNINGLNNMEKTLMNLASILVYNPKILILDEAFDSLDRFERNKVLEILQALNKEEKITIINVTQNSEDILFGTSIIILDKGMLVEHNSNEELFKNEKIFSKLGLDLPFMVDLSIKLKYYNLVDKIFYDMEEMVDVLWK